MRLRDGLSLEKFVRFFFRFIFLVVSFVRCRVNVGLGVCWFLIYSSIVWGVEVFFVVDFDFIFFGLGFFLLRDVSLI